MSCDVSATSEELQTFNKSRRKRKRSKYKGYLTKKRQKIVATSPKQCNFVTSVQRKFFFKQRKNKDDPLVHLKNKKIMSTWYWANYNKALAWRNKHKVSYWKAHALALQHENKYLLDIIQKLDPGKMLDIPYTIQDLEETNVPENVDHTFGASTSGSSSKTVPEEDELQFEMSEEMMKFFEQSFKHKMDLKKVKEEREKAMDNDKYVKESQKARLQREEEMKSLYGDGVSMIVGMETAVQLSYERHCDTKSPNYWPNIPLRL